MYCTECGTKNAPGAKFCSNCGKQLAVSKTPEEPAPVQSQTQPPVVIVQEEGGRRIRWIPILIGTLLALFACTFAGLFAFSAEAIESLTERLPFSDPIRESILNLKEFVDGIGGARPQQEDEDTADANNQPMASCAIAGVRQWGITMAGWDEEEGWAAYEDFDGPQTIVFKNLGLTSLQIEQLHFTYVWQTNPEDEENNEHADIECIYLEEEGGLGCEVDSIDRIPGMIPDWLLTWTGDSGCSDGVNGSNETNPNQAVGSTLADYLESLNSNICEVLTDMPVIETMHWDTQGRLLFVFDLSIDQLVFDNWFDNQENHLLQTDDNFYLPNDHPANTRDYFNDLFHIEIEGWDEEFGAAGSTVPYNGDGTIYLKDFLVPPRTVTQDFLATVKIFGFDCEEPLAIMRQTIFAQETSTNVETVTVPQEDSSPYDENGCYIGDAYSASENLCCPPDQYVEEYDSCGLGTYSPNTED